jgi:hypothetical protein
MKINKNKMNDIYNNQRVRDCRCPCHCHCPCIHQDYFNKSEIISDINVQNPNSEFLTSNCINESPLYSQKKLYNYTYSPNLENRNQFRKMRLRERAQSIKDKINSKYFLKGSNNSKYNRNDSFNNNFGNDYSFQLNKNPLNQSMSYLKSKINKVNEENKYLNQLLSKVPRHEKSQSKSYINNLRQSFSNEKYRKIPNTFKSYANTKKYQGYTSVIMPPNDLESVVVKSNIYS